MSLLGLYRDQLLRDGSGTGSAVATTIRLPRLMACSPPETASIALAPPDDAFFGRLADALGEPSLKHDPLYATAGRATG